MKRSASPSSHDRASTPHDLTTTSPLGTSSKVFIAPMDSLCIGQGYRPFYARRPHVARTLLVAGSIGAMIATLGKVSPTMGTAAGTMENTTWTIGMIAPTIGKEARPIGTAIPRMGWIALASGKEAAAIGNVIIPFGRIFPTSGKELATIGNVIIPTGTIVRTSEKMASCAIVPYAHARIRSKKLRPAAADLTLWRAYAPRGPPPPRAVRTPASTDQHGPPLW